MRRTEPGAQPHALPADIVIRPLTRADIGVVIQLHRELGWNPAFKADGTTINQRLEALITGDNALLLGS